MEDEVSEALDFARDRLGPKCADWIADGPGHEALVQRMRAGASTSDAVLGAVFDGMAWHRALGDEFLGYFLRRILGARVVDLYPGLRRLLDTGDLAQSVLTDLLPRMDDLRFRTEAGFLSYLIQRMRWKASDRVRSPQSTREVGMRDPDVSPAPGAGEGDESSALHQLIVDEERRALLVALYRLPERDRKILRMHLEGVPRKDIAAAVDLDDVALRQALARALKRARALLS